MGMFSFITNRTLPSQTGKDDAGRVKAFVKTGSNTLEGEYTCPDCGKSGRISQPFKRPLVIKCGGCGDSLKLPRLKDEIKREKKKRL
jgi:transcription elongation factor Elf1